MVNWTTDLQNVICFIANFCKQIYRATKCKTSHFILVNWVNLSASQLRKKLSWSAQVAIDKGKISRCAGLFYLNEMVKVSMIHPTPKSRMFH